jgi:hypothetical protein
MNKNAETLKNLESITILYYLLTTIPGRAQRTMKMVVQPKY